MTSDFPEFSESPFCQLHPMEKDSKFVCDVSPLGDNSFCIAVLVMEILFAVVLGFGPFVIMALEKRRRQL
ncbi:MAG: hypothetical protein IJW24_01390, partial [Clostridia bacterium]|nr:hypothetical protein [Clostridia bacterium]